MKQMGNAVYEQLIGLLLSMRDCHRRSGTEKELHPKEFTAHLTALSAGQKRKRNPIQLLDQNRLCSCQKIGGARVRAPLW